jgi:hypothetical protein
MCGGFVLFYSCNYERSAWPGHIAYQLGRLVSYAFLGAVGGAVGSTLDRSASLIGLQKTTLILTASLLILWGFKILIFGQGVTEKLEGRWAERLKSILARALKPGENTNWTLRASIIGALTGFLPCGLLWVYVLLAAATGDVAQGTIVMALFWLGTTPILVAVGSASKLLMNRYRQFVPKIIAVLLILAGVSLFSNHLFGQHPSKHLSKHGHGKMSISSKVEHPIGNVSNKDDHRQGE